MENLSEAGVDSRRLLLTALSVLTQITNHREPSADDVRFLLTNAQGDEADFDVSELVS